MGQSKYYQISSLRSGITNYKDYAKQNLTPRRPLFGAVIRTFIDHDYSMKFMQDIGSPVTVLTAYIAAGTTTNLTPVVLKVDGYNIVLAKNSAYSFTAKILGVLATTNVAYAKEIKGVINIGATYNTTVLLAPTLDTIILDMGNNFTAVATADTTNGGLTITVTGSASISMRWTSSVEILKL